MSAGTLDSEIEKYLPLLGNEEKQSLLTVIKSFLNLKKNSDSIIGQYNMDIDDAMARIDRGIFTEHDDLEKESKSW